jgi:hypothetical protein
MLNTILSTIPFVGVNFNVRGFVVIRRDQDAGYALSTHLSARRRQHSTCWRSWLGMKVPMSCAAPAFVRTS